MLQAQLDSHSSSHDDGHIPHHLRLSGLAKLINNNAKARVSTFAAPRIHKIDGTELVWNLVNNNELPFCHVQGYKPCVLRLEQGRERDTGFRFRGDHREIGKDTGFRFSGNCREIGTSARGDRREGSTMRFGNRDNGSTMRDNDRRNNSAPG